MNHDSNALIGKTILIGVTTVDPQGGVLEQLQMYGTLEVATDELFSIRLSSGETYTLPPDYGNVFPAQPGEYRLRSTGEVIVNPDYTTIWTICPSEAE